MIKCLLMALSVLFCTSLTLSPAGASPVPVTDQPQYQCAPDGPCPPPCLNTACAGLDADATGCGDSASNLASMTVNHLGAYLDIRHSDRCNSNWVRLRFVSGTCPYTGIEIQRRAQVDGVWKISGSQSVTKGVTCSVSSYWTKMVGGTPGQVRARYADGSASGFTWHAWGAWH